MAFSKRFFKLLKEEGTWHSLLRNKYLSTRYFSQVQIKPNASHFWKGLLKVMEDFVGCGTFNLRDGSETKFWENTWICYKPQGAFSKTV
jgi:hypothetical protein